MKVFILYARAGHGHKKAAQAIAEAFAARADGRHDLRLIDALVHTFFLFNHLYEIAYYVLVTYVPWLWGLFYWVTDSGLPRSWVAFLRGHNNRLFGAGLRRFLMRENPDVILCTHFFSAEVAAGLKREGKISSRVVAVVTDFLAHRFWVNAGTDHYIGMMEETAEDLRRKGVDPARVSVLGIPVSGRFREQVDREAIRSKLGFERRRFCILFTSGSFGIGPLARAVRGLERFSKDVQAMVVCGTNEKLFRELESVRVGFPLAVFGFVDNMHELMDLAQVLVSRSSGLTTCEALAKELPMIVISPIPGQEANNARTLRARGACFEARDIEGLMRVVGELIVRPEKMEAVREAVRKIARPSAACDIADFVLGGARP